MKVYILFTCIISLIPLSTPAAYLSASYSTNLSVSVANSAMVFVNSRALIFGPILFSCNSAKRDKEPMPLILAKLQASVVVLQKNC